MSVTNFAIRHYVAVVVLCLGIVLIGWQSYRALPRESFPDVKFPVVTVSAVLTGADPTDVESSITIPLETAIDGTEGLKKLSSNSLQGLSMIVLEFFPDVDNQVALQRVRDAVETAKKDLPPDLDNPTVREFTLASNVPILVYHLIGGDAVSRAELQQLAKKLRDEIKAISGVLDVQVSGGRQEQVVIEVDPERLHFYNLSLAQVTAVLHGSNRNAAAGASDHGSTRIVVRLPGEFRNPGDIMRLVIGATPTGTPIYLTDVATARYGYEDETSKARVYDFVAPDGKHSTNQYVAPQKAVSLSITKRAGENILVICDRVREALDRAKLPSTIRLVKGVDHSKHVNMMIGELVNGIWTALILVVAVILVTLGSRNAFIVSLAIPFSMLMGLAVLRAWGFTLNMIVLFALILALGMLVDDAIVVVENIYRRYCMNESRLDAARHGTAEVAWPVITSTLTAVGAFLPLAFWPGIVGKFMYYLPVTVMVTLLSSLFVALVISPTLAALLMRKPPGVVYGDPETQRPSFPIVRHYQRVLEFLLQRPGWTLGSVSLLLVVIVTGFVCFNHGVEFFPVSDPAYANCNVRPPEGVSIKAADELCQTLEDRLFGKPGSGYDRPVPNINYASATVALDAGGGGSLNDRGATPVNCHLEFVDREYRTQSTMQTVAEVQQRIEGLDAHGRRCAPPLYGADFDLVRAKEGPPATNPVSIDIYGDDLSAMTRVAADMRRLMAETEGVAKPLDDAATAAPTLEWTVDLPRAGTFGLERATASNYLTMAVGGLKAGTVGHGDDEQDIMLRVPEAYRANTDRLHDLFVPTPFGGSVTLGSFASVRLVPGPVNIRHYARRRVISAGADVQPGIRADASVREAFQKKAKAYAFPAGIGYGFPGAAEDQEETKAFLKTAFLLTLMIIVLIMVLQFNSVWITAIVMTSVVLAQIGVLLSLIALRLPFGIIMTGVGCISLAGIITKNAIVLLDAIRQFQARGQSDYDAIVTAAMIRFRPVLLTAGTAVLGLVPMALKLTFDFDKLAIQYDSESAQWWQSMATAIIGGLCFSTVLTLGVVPTLYLVYCRARVRCGAWWRRWTGDPA